MNDILKINNGMKEQDKMITEEPIKRHEDMEAGELELRKVFEEVTRKNVQVTIEYSKDTRRLVRELEIEIKNMRNTILSKSQEISMLKTQIAQIQGQLYQKGSK